MTLLRKSNWAAVLAVAFLAMLAGVDAQAAFDTNLTGIVEDATTFFGDIKTLVITVVVFGIAIGYAKLIKKK